MVLYEKDSEKTKIKVSQKWKLPARPSDLAGFFFTLDIKFFASEDKDKMMRDEGRDVEREKRERYERERRRRYIREKRRRKRRRQVFFARMLLALLGCLVFCGIVFIGRQIGNLFHRDGGEQSVLYRMLVKEDRKKIETPPELIVDLLTYNEYSRVGHALPTVKNIFVHYTANPGTSAIQNRSYFENLKDTHETSASAHFIIGIEGEVVQCIPTNEVAYAVAGRNYDSISIECCYESEDGRFTDATYQSLIHLTAWLISKYELDTEDILRHYDDNGKICPKYYVEHEDAWKQFKTDVEQYIEENGVTQED